GAGDQWIGRRISLHIQAKIFGIIAPGLRHAEVAMHDIERDKRCRCGAEEASNLLEHAFPSIRVERRIVDVADEPGYLLGLVHARPPISAVGSGSSSL